MFLSPTASASVCSSKQLKRDAEQTERNGVWQAPESTRQPKTHVNLIQTSELRVRIATYAAKCTCRLANRNLYNPGGLTRALNWWKCDLWLHNHRCCGLSQVMTRLFAISAAFVRLISVLMLLAVNIFMINVQIHFWLSNNYLARSSDFATK